MNCIQIRFCYVFFLNTICSNVLFFHLFSVNFRYLHLLLFDMLFRPLSILIRPSMDCNTTKLTYTYILIFVDPVFYFISFFFNCVCVCVCAWDNFYKKTNPLWKVIFIAVVHSILCIQHSLWSYLRKLVRVFVLKQTKKNIFSVWFI